MTGQDRPAIPARLAARPVAPRWGLPIPYVNEHDDGSVNFAVINGGRVLECVRHRLCGLCGQPQDFLVAFIGGPGGFDQRAYTDPPGHVDFISTTFAWSSPRPDSVLESPDEETRQG